MTNSPNNLTSYSARYHMATVVLLLSVSFRLAFVQGEMGVARKEGHKF